MVDYTDGTYAVDVWSDDTHGLVATLPKDVRCHTCSSESNINEDVDDDIAWWWDDGVNGPMLVCPCGEQYFLTMNRED